jgi:hypothetical protein
MKNSPIEVGLTEVLSKDGDVKNSGLVRPLNKWLLAGFIMMFRDFICQKVEDVSLAIAGCPKECSFSKFVGLGQQLRGFL